MKTREKVEVCECFMADMAKVWPSKDFLKPLYQIWDTPLSNLDTIM